MKFAKFKVEKNEILERENRMVDKEQILNCVISMSGLDGLDILDKLMRQGFHNGDRYVKDNWDKLNEEGQQNSGTGCPSGHSSNFCDGWNAGARSGSNNNQVMDAMDTSPEFQSRDDFWVLLSKFDIISGLPIIAPSITSLLLYSWNNIAPNLFAVFNGDILCINSSKDVMAPFFISSLLT